MTILSDIKTSCNPCGMGGEGLVGVLLVLLQGCLQPHDRPGAIAMPSRHFHAYEKPSKEKKQYAEASCLPDVHWLYAT